MSYQNKGILDSIQTHQESLFDTHLPSNQNVPLVEKFRRFHQNNPHVYEEIRKRALQEVEMGRKRISVKGIVEDIRRDGIKTEKDDYRLNNSYSALYARLLETEPWLPKGAIETRKRKA